MSPRILVVDDEPDLEALILQKFRHQIQNGTMSFLFAREGVEAQRLDEDRRIRADSYSLDQEPGRPRGNQDSR